MRPIDFDHQYHNCFEYLKRNKVHESGVLLLDKEVIKLISYLNSENSSADCLIPNLGYGELSLCAEKTDAYSSLSISRDIINSGVFSNINLINQDFLEVNITKKYTNILLFPPKFKPFDKDRNEYAYIEKSLSLLDKNGIAILLLPQGMLVTSRYSPIRDLIVNNYSLEAVFSFKRISRFSSLSASIVVVKNNKQSKEVFMTLEEKSAEDMYSDYKSGKGGFCVSCEELVDRWDASYYDPQYKEIRQKIHSRDSVKLNEIADVFNGMVVLEDNRRDVGDYLLIRPKYICDGQLCFDNEKKFFCDSEYVNSKKSAQRSVLKKGDIIISNVGEPRWAVYCGEENFAIANDMITIIRAKHGYEKLVNLFFSSKIGAESLKAQIRLLRRGVAIPRIELSNIFVPDVDFLTATESIKNEKNFEKRIYSLFVDLGWTVKSECKFNDRIYDLELFYQDKLYGVVECKMFKSERVIKDLQVAMKLRYIKAELKGVSVYLFVDDALFEYIDESLVQLSELPRPNTIGTHYGKESIDVKKGETVSLNSIVLRNSLPFVDGDEELIVRPVPDAKSTLSINRLNSEEKSVYDSLLTELYTGGLDAINSRLDRIEGKVDTIITKIDELSKQITGYQSLVDKQLELAVSNEEEERIIHAFSEECAERIIKEVGNRDSTKEYNIELNKLVLTFGDDAWSKMDESSKRFLISAKVLFNNLIGLQDYIDYSGVCVLVTKALEVEMSKRFCTNYINFLKEKYPGKANYFQFPSMLLDREGRPIKAKHFTLGNIAYVLCHYSIKDLPEEKAENNRKKLMEYSREKLFSGKSDDEISSLLHEYAESIEEVKRDYRNPSAHTDTLRRVDAEECFALVVDVEKHLKNMLDSFDM